MSKQAIAALVVVTMIVVIVSMDVVFFRHHLWARLLANVGVVLVVAAFYLRFVGHR